MSRPPSLDFSLSVSIGENSGEFLGASGPWKAAPPGPAVKDRSGATLTVWRADLPSEPAQQQAALNQAEAGLQPLVTLGSSLNFDQAGPVGGGLTQFRQAMTLFSDQLAALQNLIRQDMQVETAVAGRPVARTVLHWSGDMETTWLGMPDPQQVAQHFRVLQLSLRSHQAYLRLWGALAHFTNLIQSQVSVPGPLGLLAAYKYMLAVMNIQL
jgi:hypothetical protein